MSSLSIRGVDEKLSKILKTKALNSNKSMNQYVLDLLKKSAGLKKEKIYTGIRRFRSPFWAMV